MTIVWRIRGKMVSFCDVLCSSNGAQWHADIYEQFLQLPVNLAFTFRFAFGVFFCLF